MRVRSSIAPAVLSAPITIANAERRIRRVLGAKSPPRETRPDRATAGAIEPSLPHRSCPLYFTSHSVSYRLGSLRAVGCSHPVTDRKLSGPDEPVREAVGLSAPSDSLCLPLLVAPRES